MVRTRWVVAAMVLLCVTGCTSVVSGSGRLVRSGCVGGRIVSPGGAPYCYVVPPGFSRTKATLGGAGYPSAVSMDNHDIIVAGVFPAPSDLDLLTDNELANAVDDLIGREDSAGFHLVSTAGKLTKPAAGRALEYRATTHTRPPITIDLYVVTKGHTKVQLNCQYTAQRAKVEAACAQVLASLRIISPDS